MNIGNTGRRGLFGLLCGAPVAMVAAGAKADETADPLVLVTLPPGIAAKMKRHGSAMHVDIIVEAVERKMASRLERTYGLQSLGRS